MSLLLYPEAPPAPLPSTSALPVLDEGRLRELLETVDPATGVALLREVLDMYRRETQPRLGRLVAAWSAGEAAGVRKEAQFLAGSSANLGYKRLAGWLRDLETYAKEGPLPAFPRLESILNAEWRGACGAYEKMLARLEGVDRSGD